MNLRKYRMLWFSLFLLVWMIRPVAAAETSKGVAQYLKTFDGSIGVYAENLKTGKSFKYKENDLFPAASTSKLVVSLAVYKYLYPKVDDEVKETYDTNIYWMIHTSDNDAFHDLLNAIDSDGGGALKKTIADLKLRKTMIHDEEAFNKFGYHSVTTPQEMATVFRQIDKGKYLTTQLSKVLKEELANTIFHDEIPRYMETTVLHKVGELDDVLCDVGIVDDGKNRILISIYTRSEKSVDYKSDVIATTAAKLYNLLR